MFCVLRRRNKQNDRAFRPAYFDKFYHEIALPLNVITILTGSAVSPKLIIRYAVTIITSSYNQRYQYIPQC